MRNCGQSKRRATGVDDAAAGQVMGVKPNYTKNTKCTYHTPAGHRRGPQLWRHTASSSACQLCACKLSRGIQTRGRRPYYSRLYVDEVAGSSCITMLLRPTFVVNWLSGWRVLSKRKRAVAIRRAMFIWSRNRRAASHDCCECVKTNNKNP